MDDSSLAMQYLSDRKEYDTQVIALDFQRREVRRRRQAIADCERRMLHRRRVLQRQQADFEMDDPDSLQKMQILEREIFSLRSRLRHALTSLKLEEAKLSPITPKSLSSANGLDQEYLVSCLCDQQHQLQAQRNELDQRIFSARRVLAEPIDDIRLNEMLLEEAEDDADRAERKLSAIPLPSPEAFECDVRKLEALEEENRDRKRELYRQRSWLLSAKAALSQGQQTSVRDRQKRDRTCEADCAKLPGNENMRNFIEEMFQAFAARQQKVAREEKQTDLVESQNRTKRRELEEEWELKVREVQRLKGRLRNREHLMLAIDSVAEAIEGDAMSYRCIRSDKKRVRRQVRRMLRDKDDLAARRREVDLVKTAAANRKKQKVQEEDDRLAGRRQQLANAERETEDGEAQYELQNKNVIQLETQMKELAAENDAKFSEIEESRGWVEASETARSSITAFESNSTVGETFE
jgi:hypothetical protein